MPRPRLLSVEDDDAIREALGEILEHEGYDVTMAATAEAGVELLAGAAFDAVLTDYRLPGENGAWLLARACRPGGIEPRRAIVLTGEHRPAGVEAHRVLTKPIDLD